MDLSTITVADFKAQFRRDFPFLPVYSGSALYNAGAKVYYSITELFYECKANGTTGIVPTTQARWHEVSDSIDNYVQDSDIERAFIEAKAVFNQALFGSDEEIKQGYLYLTAHYLVMDLRAAMGGLFAAGTFPMTSRSAGNVSESYGVPSAYTEDPALAYLAGSAYGMKYLSLVIAATRGNVFVVQGATLP